MNAVHCILKLSYALPFYIQANTVITTLAPKMFNLPRVFSTFAVSWQIWLILLSTARTMYAIPATASKPVLVGVGGTEGNIVDVDIFTPTNENRHKNQTQVLGYLILPGTIMVNNMVYVVGGENVRSKNATHTFMVYSITDNTWSNLPDFPAAVMFNTVVALNDELIISLGGWQGLEAGPLTDVYAYNVTNNNGWQRLPTPVPAASFNPCAVVVNQSSIYYIVRENGSMYRSGDGAQTWSQLSSMSSPRGYSTCTALEDANAIVVAGGVLSDGQPTPRDSVEVYDIATNTWKTHTVHKARKHAAAIAMVLPGTNTSTVVVCGGFTTAVEDEATSSCELLDFKNYRWNLAEFSLSAPRFAFGLFVGQSDF